MAELKVSITGDSKGIEKAADKAGRALDGVGKKVDKVSRRTRSGFKGATGQITDLSSSFDLISTGLESLAITARSTFKTFREEADRSAKAVNSALGKINVAINTGPGLNITSRDQLVELGRNAQAELAQVNQALDSRGLLVRLQENDTILSSVAETAANIGGLFSNQVRAQQAHNQELIRQRKIQSDIVDFAKDQLAAIDAAAQVSKDAKKAGGFVIPGQGPVTPRPISISPGRTPKPDSFGALPSSGFGFGTREFDESISEATIKLIRLERVLKAGVITSLDASRERVNLMTERLRVMAEDGVSPSTEVFMELKESLQAAKDVRFHETINEITSAFNNGLITGADAAREKIQAMREQAAQLQQLGNNAGAQKLRSEALKLNLALEIGEDLFNGIRDAGEGAIDALIFKTQKLKDVLRDSLKRTGANILKSILGVGLDFVFPGGNVLSSVLGKKGPSSIPAFASGGIVTKPTTALIGEAGPEAVIPLDKLSGMNTVRIEATTLRFDGSQFLLDIRQAENTRGVGF